MLVGVGQVLHRAGGLDDARSPVELMADAVREAVADAGLVKLPRPDSIRAVSLLSWRYGDPAGFVAAELGLEGVHTGLYHSGGESPQALLNLTAGQIQRGELDMAILVGGEAWRTRMRARRSGSSLSWPDVTPLPTPDSVYGGGLDLTHPAEVERGIRMPVQVYPMFETALRASAGRPVGEHLQRISELWSRFSDVASANPSAWSPVARSAEEIRTPGPSNRMIGAPYPKLMNSNNDVDMGAALIVCSAERAAALGVPRDRWVFLQAGAGTHEHIYVSNRDTFARTPAIEIGGREALTLAGVGIDDIAIVDLYSCFPSAVQLGAQSLGLPINAQLTRTGGLSFGGGPWNNYVMHAIATVVGECRKQEGDLALVWANGGFCTKHSFGVYSTEPPTAGFRHSNPQAEVDALARRDVTIEYAGPAAVEAYTVMHDRDGAPEQAFAACLLADGRRTWVTSSDADLMQSMLTTEWVGTPVTVDSDGRLHARS